MSKRVAAIGGVFFKAENPSALNEWYREHLGFDIQNWGGAQFFARDDQKPDQRHYSVWSPFSADTKYFAPSVKPYMLNLRVDDLDAVLAALRAEGVQVLDRQEQGEQGKFGYVLDPEGTLLELWQPNPDDASLV